MKFLHRVVTHHNYNFFRNGAVQAVYNNAARQLAVNDRARYVGSGTGTAYAYGVPGSGNYFGYNNYGYGGYGYGGYGTH